ncbi:MAG: hypothetical protein ACI4I9_01695 [Porcipelethomonas sp.]
MRDLKRNQTKIFYRMPKGLAEEKDDYGNVLGSFSPVYGELKSLRISVSANKGTVSEEIFGSLLDYDRTMSVSDADCEIDENTVLWIGITPDKPYNFIVRRKAASINSTVYAIKQVTVGENTENKAFV